MSFVSRILEKIVPPKQDNTGENTYKPPVLSETLERSERFLDEFNGWLNSEAYINPVTLIRNAYEFKKIGTDFHVNLHIFNSQQSNGFYFTFNDSFGKNDFAFLLDYFKNRVLELNYKLYTSTHEIYELSNHIRGVEMHYLKPNNRDQKEGKIDQQYGNIHMELVKVNDQPNYIKIMANVYSDSLYQSPKPFDAFIDHLFKTETPDK